MDLRILFLFLSLSFYNLGQKNLDTNFQRRKTVTSVTLSTVLPSSIVGLSQVWFGPGEFSSFHFFDDGKEWLGMDKLGHVYTAQHLSELTFKTIYWSGVDRPKSALLGAGIGFLYQNSLEILDGFGNQWGFSAWDVFSNGVGSALFLSQELLWERQIIRLKFSYHPTSFPQYNPNVLGTSPFERFFKDYNGQTYWASVAFSDLPALHFVPKWLSLSLGYSVNDKIYGSDNYAQINGNVFQASSQVYLSLDLNIDGMNIQKQWVKALLSPLNWIKIPFPALQFSKTGISGKWFYF